MVSLPTNKKTPEKEFSPLFRCSLVKLSVRFDKEPKSFNNAKKEMPKHFLTYDLSKTTAIDKEPTTAIDKEPFFL
jgi:hypothetical protein